MSQPQNPQINDAVISRASNPLGLDIVQIIGPGAGIIYRLNQFQTVWYAGSGAPSVNIPGILAGNMYVDQTNADLWVFNGTAWTPIGSSTVPTPGPTTLGGVFSHPAVLHQFLNSINTDGTVGSAQPAFTDISGTASIAQLPFGTPSAGQIPVATSPTTAVWQTQPSTTPIWVNVKNFGATGNGVTDDTTAIQNAVNSITSSSAGRVLYFPTGVYIYSGSGITGNAFVAGVVGDGPTSSLLQAANSSVTGSALTFTATANGLFFENMGFIGPGQTAAGGQDGIVISNGGSPVREPAIINCEVNNWPGKAVNITTPILARFQGNRVQNNVHGFYVNGGTSVSFIGNYPNNNLKAGYWLNATTYSYGAGGAGDTNGITWLLQGLTVFTLDGSGHESGKALNLPITQSSASGTQATFTYSGPDQSADAIGNGRTIVINGSTNIPAANAGISGLGDGRWPIASATANTITINLTGSVIGTAADTGNASFWAGDGIVINGSTVIQVDGFRGIASQQSYSSLIVAEGAANQITLTGLRQTTGSGVAQTTDEWFASTSNNIVRINNAFSGQTYQGPTNLTTYSNGLWTFPQSTTVGTAKFDAGLQSLDDAIVQDNSSATSGSNVNSPALQLNAHYWDGAASQVDEFTTESVPGSGANPLMTYQITHTSGSSGGSQFAFGSTFKVGGGGQVTAANLFSNTAQIATAGFVRLAVSDLIDWRNNANSGNLPLGIDGSDRLIFNTNLIALANANVPTGTAGDIVTLDSSHRMQDSGVLLSSLTSTSPVSFNAATIHEDFISLQGSGAVSTVVTFSGDSGTWALLQIVAACSIQAVAGAFNNPGIIAFVTGATSGNGGCMYKTGGTSSTATLGALGSNSAWEMNFYVNLPSSANVCFRAGACIAGQNAADAPSTWLGCELNTANTGNSDVGYTLVARNAGTASYAGNTVAPSGGSTYDHIRIFSTSAGTIQMSINGANTVSLGTNVPTASVGLFFQAITRTTAAKTVNLDAVSYMAQTARS